MIFLYLSSKLSDPISKRRRHLPSSSLSSSSRHWWRIHCDHDASSSSNQRSSLRRRFGHCSRTSDDRSWSCFRIGFGWLLLQQPSSRETSREFTSTHVERGFENLWISGGRSLLSIGFFNPNRNHFFLGLFDASTMYQCYDRSRPSSDLCSFDSKLHASRCSQKSSSWTKEK